MLSQDPKEMMPILFGMFAIGGIILLIDMVLLIRWMIYQNQVSAAIAHAGMPLYPPTNATALPAPSSEEETAPLPPAPAAIVDPAALPHVPRPFAPTWSLVHPFLAIQFVIMAASTLTAIPIALIMIGSLFMGGKAGNPNDTIQNAMTYAVIFGLFVQNALFVGVVAWFLKRYGTSLQEIGLRRPTQQQILLGVGLGLALALMASGLEQAMSLLLPKVLAPGTIKSLERMTEALSAGTQFKDMPNFWLKALFLLGGAVAAPIGEEVFFRGFLYNALKARLNVPAAIVLSGLMFAVVHFGPLAVVIIFPMGMLLAYVYERTRSLWVTILMHCVNNGLAFILLWIYGK